MATLEDETAENDTLFLWIAFDYGSRAELVYAVQQLMREGVDPEDVSEQTLAQRLYAPELPDPDLVIRTSGEQRISNFLLWQSAYSEFDLHGHALAGLRRGAAPGRRRRVRAQTAALRRTLSGTPDMRGSAAV